MKITFANTKLNAWYKNIIIILIDVYPYIINNNSSY